MIRIRRGGAYYRVCKPEWSDCTDTAFSAVYGGRWNPPGEHRVLYLNRTVRMAARKAIENFAGEAHSLFDLRPERRPSLQTFAVEEAEYVDAVTDPGVESLGLPVSYPDGVGWEECQPLGRELYQAGERGVACRTALGGGADADHEELAHFDRGDAAVQPGERRAFADWFPAGHI